MGCSSCAASGCIKREILPCAPAQYRVFLLGPANSGKSTLFNMLTGSRQTIGNWPGVTVDRKSGTAEIQGLAVEFVDLPGISSLSAPQAERIDERVARDALTNVPHDALLIAVDLSAPHRGLSMLLQARGNGVPVIAVLTKADCWTAAAVDNAAAILTQELGVPAVPVSGRTLAGLDQLHAALVACLQAREGLSVIPASTALPARVASALEKMRQALEGGPEYENANTLAVARRLMERDWLTERRANADLLKIRDGLLDEAGPVDGVPADQYLTDAPLAEASALVRRIDMPAPVGRRFLSDRIDRIALSPLFGPALFLGVMYVLFFLTINVSGVFIDLFDGLGQAAFVETPALLFHWLGLSGSAADVAVGAVGTGIQTVGTFVPVVGFLFLCQIFLEESGYMTRAAVVADRLMRRLGLSGRAFLPLVLGFGCTIPAVLATRTLDTRAERILTSMMAPFMSCGARLPVYALFAAAFFPVGGQNVVFALYLIGIAAALFTGWMLAPRLTLQRPRPLAIELPIYQMPPLSRVLRLCWARIRQFVAEAGKTIVIVVALLSFLNSVGPDGSFGNEDNGTSILALTARQVTPVLEPMGVRADNWPAAVGLFTGMFAKETVVGTLQALYAAAEPADDAAPRPLETAETALRTLGASAAGLASALLDPLGLDVGDISSFEIAASEQDVPATVFAEMNRNFGSKAAAFAYLLAVLLYIPCVATLSAIAREIGAWWAAFAAGWTTIVAYAGATIAYQAGTFAQHPEASIGWLAGMGLLILLIFAVARCAGRAGPHWTTVLFRT
ncbi:ferrous iron transport protein B [Roseibium sediminicola]|uniref:Ferrous iron transport protein B n=1 Tax=Roseibium sediminicola TaxID=2933272 RepID=A0ABT0GNX3_9HYPH|nr:ferrous iron transport protein B [Roseibium sp. CAU 1639]MCK7611124.1 ferrous iron transport protein B [Roseibium sp. CAU 1639]